MPHIVILSSSVRKGRASHRVALYLEKYISDQSLSVEVLDLNQYNFPVFEERLQYLKNPSEQLKEFANKIVSADAVVIVTPEYNGGYPAALKNAIDLLYKEWYHKPIAIAAVSDGVFGATQVVTSLVFTLWKIGAWVVPAKFHVSKVTASYDELGIPVNKEASDKAANNLVKELLWAVGLNKSR